MHTYSQILKNKETLQPVTVQKNIFNTLLRIKTKKHKESREIPYSWIERFHFIK